MEKCIYLKSIHGIITFIIATISSLECNYMVVTNAADGNIIPNWCFETVRNWFFEYWKCIYFHWNTSTFILLMVPFMLSGILLLNIPKPITLNLKSLSVQTVSMNSVVQPRDMICNPILFPKFSFYVYRWNPNFMSTLFLFKKNSSSATVILYRRNSQSIWKC